MNRIITDKNEIMVALRYVFAKNAKFRVFYGRGGFTRNPCFCYVHAHRPETLDFKRKLMIITNQHTQMTVALETDHIVFVEIDTNQNPLTISEIRGVIKKHDLDCKYLVIEGMSMRLDDENSLEESISPIAGRSTIPMY